MATLNIVFDNLHIYLFVFIRLTGIIFLNPVLSTTKIMPTVKLALILMTTILITPLVPVSDVSNNIFDFMLAMGRELFIGFSLTFVFSIYYYMLMFVADVMDTQFGLAMAKMLNPQTNIQSAATGNIINVFFMLYFFATNSHLELIETAINSFDVVPAGATSISIVNICQFLFGLFTSVCLLALRLGLPFIAAEFILEISMGVLMKLIPQIHVFVINMQSKILLCLILLMVMAAPMASFIDNYIVDMFRKMQSALSALAG